MRAKPIITLLAALAVLGCGAPAWQQAPHDRPFQRAPAPKLHEQPAELVASDWWEAFYGGSFEQISRLVSPGYHIQRGGGGPDALDVNAFGKVPDSTWYVNRLGKRNLTYRRVLRGPDTVDGPAPGKLLVLSAKETGVTPGLMVRDSRGDRWVVKFDPPAYPNLASAAELISTKALWAVGYNVPENYLHRFAIEDLELGETATTKNRFNQKIPFTRPKLLGVLRNLNPEPDGRIRAMFSRLLPGKPVGPFRQTGTRLDDPNDRIPHERRRSLRGLWVFYAWLNNTDAKLSNTLDMFVEVDEKRELGYVKHYLIDFGTTLGSGATGPKSIREGYDYLVDWERLGARFLAVGAYYPYWVTLERVPLRSVGAFESRVFEPGSWRPMYPNRHLEAADPHDTFWAASILAHFDPLLIAAAVDAGDYADPAARKWVYQVLVERRAKLLRYAFRNMLPLDNVRVHDGGERVSLSELDVLAGLTAPRSTRYRYALVWERGADPVTVTAGTVTEATLHLRGARQHLRKRYGEALERNPFLTLRWTRAGEPAGPRVDVHLRLLSDDSWLPVGIERTSG